MARRDRFALRSQVLTDVVSDTTPQLGGNLDANGFEIQQVTGDLIVSSQDSSVILEEAGTKVAGTITGGLELVGAEDAILNLVEVSTTKARLYYDGSANQLKLHSMVDTETVALVASDGFTEYPMVVADKTNVKLYYQTNLVANTTSQGMQLTGTSGAAAVLEIASSSGQASAINIEEVSTTKLQIIYNAGSNYGEIATKVAGEPMRISTSSGASIICNQAGSVDLYHNTDQVVKTNGTYGFEITGVSATASGLQIMDGSTTVQAYMGFISGSNLSLQCRVNSSHLILYGRDASSTLQSLFVGDPDDAATVYYAGTAAAATFANGWDCITGFRLAGGHFKLNNVGGDADQTISSGAITVSTCYNRIDTEAAAATDDLVTINGTSTGRVIILRTTANTRDVVVKHGTGNILLNGAADFTLSNVADHLMLIFNGSNWCEIGRGDNA